MAKYAAQPFVFLVVFAALSSYLASQLVDGVALKQAEDNYKMDDNRIQTSDEGTKNCTADIGDSAIEFFPVSKPHLELRFNNSRRRLGQFEDCSNCYCCDITRTEIDEMAAAKVRLEMLLIQDCEMTVRRYAHGQAVAVTEKVKNYGINDCLKETIRSVRFE
ncbi:unnamed protein product [Calypogeia fissa]